jgi:hypothetical protein
LALVSPPSVGVQWRKLAIMSKCLENFETAENLRWQFSPGTGGSFQTEWVAIFTGLGGRFGPEYALGIYMNSTINIYVQNVTTSFICTVQTIFLVKGV